MSQETRISSGVTTNSAVRSTTRPTWTKCLMWSAGRASQELRCVRGTITEETTSTGKSSQCECNNRRILWNNNGRLCMTRHGPPIVKLGSRFEITGAGCYRPMPFLSTNQFSYDTIRYDDVTWNVRLKKMVKLTFYGPPCNYVSLCLRMRPGCSKVIVRSISHVKDQNMTSKRWPQTQSTPRSP